MHPSRQVQGVDAVMGLAAVYACVRYIADAVASLPINIYRRQPDGTPVRLATRPLLDNPSADASVTLYDWVFQCLTSALLWGNSWGLISSRTGIQSPNGLGYPQTIEWLPPDQVQVQDDPEQPYNPLRAKIYFQGKLLNKEELVHVRAFVIPGRTEAISPMRAFAMLWEQGIDALKYSADWFRNGGFPPGTFQNVSEEVDADSAREIRMRLTESLRLRQPLVYGRDWDYKPVVVPPSEAAFVEAMQLNATQVAAVYGVPPTKVGGSRGDSLTYATQEQETLSLISDTLRPWLVRMEHLLTSLLPRPQFARFDTDALLKTDLKTRTEIYQIQRNIGLRPIDEIRKENDWAPLPGAAGEENIPLEAMVRMSSTTRAIPKSMMPFVVLEQDLAADRLVKLQQQGLTPPDLPPGDPGYKPPVKQTPEGYLGLKLTSSRGVDGELPTGAFGAKPHRATSADRERAVNWIELAARAGCLDAEERSERIGKALAARIRGSLDDLVRDLPPEAELNGLLPAGGRRGEGEIRDAKLTFGPAALALLHARNMQEEFDPAGLGPAAPNGKGH